MGTRRGYALRLSYLRYPKGPLNLCSFLSRDVSLHHMTQNPNILSNEFIVMSTVDSSS